MVKRRIRPKRLSMSNGRDIIASENKMLDLLVAVIDEFAKHYSGFEFTNLKCWGQELSGYKDINEQYLRMTDKALRAALAEEVDVLVECRKAITSTTPAAKYWKNNLKENISYTRGVMNRI